VQGGGGVKWSCIVVSADTPGIWTPLSGIYTTEPVCFCEVAPINGIVVMTCVVGQSQSGVRSWVTLTFQHATPAQTALQIQKQMSESAVQRLESNHL
jgi:hypothetical protein